MFKNAKSCNMNNNIIEIKETLNKLLECYIKREVYQFGSISKQDKKKIDEHNKQIEENKDKIIKWYEIIYDQTNI